MGRMGPGRNLISFQAPLQVTKLFEEKAAITSVQVYHFISSTALGAALISAKNVQREATDFRLKSGECGSPRAFLSSKLSTSQCRAREQSWVYVLAQFWH